MLEIAEVFHRSGKRSLPRHENLALTPSGTIDFRRGRTQSGDAVSALATQLGIAEFHAACTPQQKLAIIETAQRRGERVVMVGDGINDAPVLSGADTSVAPAQGALLAQTSADVIMLGDSLAPLLTLLEMSARTMRIVRQNLAWAIVYNALALPLAAAGLVPPWLAAIGMSASSLIVVLNALRLSRFQ